MMQDCWLAEPDKRPSFTQLRDRLDAMIESYSPVQYLSFEPLSETDFKHRSCDDNELQNDVQHSLDRPLRRSASNRETVSVSLSSSPPSCSTFDNDLRCHQLKRQPLIKPKSKVSALQPLRVWHRSQDDLVMTSSCSMHQLLSRSSGSSSDPGYETQKSWVNLTSELTGETKL